MLMSLRNSPASSSPSSTILRRCSHSAVSSGERRASGSTVTSDAPALVGTSLPLTRSAETAVYELFNRRRAGGGCPEAAALGVAWRFCVVTSCGIGSFPPSGEKLARSAAPPFPTKPAGFAGALPACSMAASSVSSVNAAGGVVLPSLTLAVSTAMFAPSVSSGSGVHSGRAGVRAPAEVDDASALSLEDVSAALYFDLGFGVSERLGNRAQQLAADEPQNSRLALGQCGEVGAPSTRRGYNGVVVSDARAVTDLLRVYACWRVSTQQLRRNAYKLRHRCGHAVGQIPAVRARVGHELLFVEALQIIQRLLRREAQLSVGLALERGSGRKVRAGSRAFPGAQTLTICARGTCRECFASPRSLKRSLDSRTPPQSSATV